MRMLVFPYGHDCEPIIRHANLLDPCYEIAAIVSPGGWGLDGKNVTLGRNEVVLPVYDSIKKVPEEFDSLFIPAFEVSNEVVENRLIDEIIKIIPLLDFVICTARVTDTNRKKLEEACSNADPTCVFKDLTKHDGPEAYALVAPSEKYPSLHMPNVPMVVVAGCWEKTDKFEVSLALRERFIENGYRLLQIGSRDGCEMLGFHSFPGFMLRRDVDATDKIFYFNRWILKRVKEEQPDLILLTIPGATQDFNEQFTRGSGLLHHQVFQAITPDVLLLCTFYMPDSLKILEDLALSCKYRFGASVDAFHMSNLFVDIIDSQQFNHVITNSIYRETVSDAIRGLTASSIPVFNMLDSTDCDRMFDNIIEKLSPKDVQFVI